MPISGKLSLAILVPELGYGGVERGVLEQARAFTKAGDTVWILGARGPNVTRLFESGARFIEAPLHRKDPISVGRSVSIFRRFMAYESVDVVEAVSRVPAWVAHLVLRGRKNRPGFLTSAHGFYRPHYLSRSITYGDRIIAVSEALKAHLVDRLGADPARIRVVPRGVDPEEFHPFSATERQRAREELGLSSDKFVVGMVSRMRRGKGLEVLLAAGARLKSDGIPIVLVFVGAGSPNASANRNRFAARFQAQIAAGRAENWIYALAPTAQVNRILNTLDVAVVPSTQPEAFGRGVIEAMAAGVPVVASRLGAIPEIVHDGVNGLLFEAGDSRALAGVLTKLYHDPDRRRALAESGVATVRRRFSLSDCLDATHRVLTETARVTLRNAR